MLALLWQSTGNNATRHVIPGGLDTYAVIGKGFCHDPVSTRHEGGFLHQRRRSSTRLEVAMKKRPRWGRLKRQGDARSNLVGKV